MVDQHRAVNLRDLPAIDVESPAFQNVATAEALVAPYRDETGFVRTQRGIEALSFAAASNVLRDNRFDLGLSVRAARIGVDKSSRAHKIFMDALMNQNQQDHIRLRKAITPWFNVRNSERMRGDVRRWINAWLDEQDEAGVVDFQTAVSRRLPASLFALLVGAPVEDWAYIADVSERVLVLNKPVTPESGPIFEAATTEAADYVLDLLKSRRGKAGEDLLSFFAEAQVSGDLTEDDIVSLVWTMLVGSTDTTTSQINLNLQTLAENPGQWEVLRSRPGLVPNAVVELTRFNPNIWVMWRAPKADLDYLGNSLTPDDVILPAVYAANFDPLVYDDPRRLDVSREIKMSLGFGSGMHSCLGRMFAVMEEEEVLRAVLDRWSAFEVVEHHHSGVPYVVMPETFKVAPRRI